MKQALIVVDVQNDFLPASPEAYAAGMGGALAVTNGDAVIPVINKLLPEFDLVIFTKDWHDPKMDAFASTHPDKNPFDGFINKQGEEDTLWPDHCVANTPGAAISKDIDFGLIKGDFYIFKKGLKPEAHPYSGFGAEGLEEFLNEKGIEVVFVTGLALDYCVKDTAVDAALKGFNTIVIKDGTAPIDPNIDETLVEFDEADVKIIESWELGLFNITR